jgi:hypothetical protein
VDISQFHPKIARLYDYWLQIHPPDGLPGRHHFDRAAIAPLLSNIWLLEVEREPFRLRYRLIGSRVDTVLGRKLSGRYLDESYSGHPNWPALEDDYRCVVVTGEPYWRRGAPRVIAAENCATLEVLRLPLAHDGKSVNMILAQTLFFGDEGHEIERGPMAPPS